MSPQAHQADMVQPASAQAPVQARLPEGLVLIGASTGGVQALMAVLPGLPATLRLSVVVLLHLPPDRPSLLVELLAPLCALPVREPDDKESIAPGIIYVAPPNYHLMVEAGTDGLHFALSVDEAVNYSRPSIDVLFESAAAALPALPMVGVVLSGASRDGARGAQALALAGARVWVQDPGSAEASLMPSAVTHAVPSSTVMPLQRMAPALCRIFDVERSSTSKEPR